jgi:16S rRNA (cytosine1402-N4)-methyltransferase
MHIPALLKEIVNAFKGIDQGVIFDGTVGNGGHARAILSNCGKKVKLIAVDRDIQMLQSARTNLSEFAERILFVNDSFHNIRKILSSAGIASVDGILLDTGAAFEHYDNFSRGFSFRSDAPLDMRYNTNEGKTALEILKTISAKELAEKLSKLGDISKSVKIAQRIKDAVRNRTLKTTQDLVRIAASCGFSETKGIHPATRIFMVLRMITNQEMECLDAFLNNFPETLGINGICAVISYSSADDRAVKRKFRDLSKNDFVPVTKKAIRPCGEEIRQNKRARSSKLRIIKKIK